MTVDAILDGLRARGVHLFREGKSLRFRAPVGAMSPALRTLVAKHRSEILEHVNAWPAAAADFALLLKPDDLPFELSLGPGRRVIDRDKFLAALKRDVLCGPRGPRAMYGAVQADLLAIRDILCRGRAE